VYIGNVYLSQQIPKMHFKNLKDLFTKFPDEKTCTDYLIQQRWNGNVECAFCGCTKVYKIEGGKRFKCADTNCAKKFSATVGTVYENSKVGLQTFFAALYLISSSKKGISSLQLSRQLGITQKTAWFVLHRLREMLKDKAPQSLLTGTIEIDETYVGGKEKNKHKSKRLDKTGMQSKSPMVGLLQRDGTMVVKVLDKGTANGITIKPIIRENVSKDATIYTDGFGAYKDLNLEFAQHRIVDHSGGEYVIDKIIHTNSIEGFWSVLKRGIYGIYHQVSHKHLHRYCDEFAARYNTRKIADNERFEVSVKNSEGRLKYNDLIAK
jgi:transposase-like protein